MDTMMSSNNYFNQQEVFFFIRFLLTGFAAIIIVYGLYITNIIVPVVALLCLLCYFLIKTNEVIIPRLNLIVTRSRLSYPNGYSNRT